jgi:hypothetical protein
MSATTLVGTGQMNLPASSGSTEQHTPSSAEPQCRATLKGSHRRFPLQRRWWSVLCLRNSLQPAKCAAVGRPVDVVLRWCQCKQPTDIKVFCRLAKSAAESLISLPQCTLWKQISLKTLCVIRSVSHAVLLRINRLNFLIFTYNIADRGGRAV